jgi:pseudouridine-5'-phosphate glycosidase
MRLRVSEEVKHALENNLPVVALESTIISHGMPYPKNVETALLVEKTIRDNGAIPATIGIIEGECIVGLSAEEIELFGKRKGIAKVSRRDLPIITSKNMWGATTVATTMIIAALAGVKIFVTGGIGGVHRGVEDTMDISADLQELARTNVCVICAGAKAILDLPRTLEYLETMGVPVLGYGVEELPAFYSRESGLKVDYRVDSGLEVAKILKEKWDMKLDGGVLVTNPIPQEYSYDFKEMEKIIDQAIEEMKKQGIKGKDTTPFLLAYIKELTGGNSLESNIALVLNNAVVGAGIAKEFAKL